MTELSVGTNVDIQRTNGRIHSAVISSIDLANKSVTVEWSEANEIKGKEIDFETVFLLNPALNNMNASSNHSISVPRKMGPPPRPSAVPVPSSKGSMRVRPFNNRQTIANSNGVALEPITQSIAFSQIPPPTTTGVRKSTIATANGANNKNQNKQDQHHIENNNGTSNGASNGNANENRRRSNVVKEVDKIKKQREERRARQEREKEDKAELMRAVDQGNPNWEFLGMIREYRAQLDYKPISHSDSVTEHQICVAVRKRPMNKKEASRKDIDVVTVPSKNLIMVHEPKQKVDLTRYLEHQNFRFDYSFDEAADNELVYKYTAKPLIHTVFEGGMATCFAYGQTGSGKTHTMGGDFSGKSQDSTKGIYALSARDVFKLIKTPKYRNEDLVVHASFFEIYSGKVFDLLNGKAKLRVLEDARQQVQVVGLTEKTVESVDDVLKIISTGNNIRTSGVTSANNHSSRSHAVFQIILKKRVSNKLHGKFSLIDLAGNERGADTSSSSRVTRMEGAEINKSLLALKECIRALGRRGAHLPFRASKLTQVLRDSFIGENSRTCMIAMISPGMQSCEHSLNTLRYANRVKELGADGPELKNTDGDAMETIPADDSLVHRNGNQSFHDEDYSEEMVTFHEAISHLQDMEEEVLDLHKNYYDCFPRWMQTHNALLKMTQEVDYDVDGYSQRVEEALDEHLVLLQGFKDKVSAFRGELAAEEIMSKKIVPKKK